MFKLTYDKIKQTLTRKNRREANRLSISILKKGMNNKLSKDERDLIKKIDNYLSRSHFELPVTREMILLWCSNIYEDPLHQVACQSFVKDALKQTASEMAQIETMNNRGFEIQKLLSSGTNSLRFDENSSKLIPTKIEGVTSRSLDYKREYNGFVEYFTGKVTFGKGGGQNNVKEEIINFLKRSNTFLSKNPNSNFVFTVLVDGDSLTDKDLLNYSKYTSEKVRLMSCDNYTPYEGNYNSI